MDRRGTLAGAALITLASLVAPDRQEPADTGPVLARSAADTCAVCHPAAVDGLRLSVHRTLLTEPATRDNACSVCHGDAAAHVASARRPEDELVPAPPVGAASCDACHPGTAWDTALAAHRWVRSETVAQAVEAGEAAVPAPAVPAARGLGSFDWSGLLSVGARFVSHVGSADRFATDVNLDPGVRLVEGRLVGTGDAALLDRIELQAFDVGDPWTRWSAEVSKEDVYRARAGREERLFVHRTRGDFSRVEHDRRTTTFGLDLELSTDLTLYGDFERFHDDGIWLTRRLTSRTPPGLSVDGVASPRRIVADDLEAGLSGTVRDTRFRIAATWLEERHDDRWRFDRPAPANPAFDEAEDFRSVARLEGPGAVLTLDRRFGPAELSFDLRHRELDREVDAGGFRSGADPIPFTTDTSARADGHARTTSASIGATIGIADPVTFALDLDWRAHEEEMDLLQVDTTRFPTSGGLVTTTEQREHRTVERALEGAAELEAEVVDGLLLALGWGFSRLELRLPDLVAGDLDPTQGTVRDDGLVLGAEWRPDDAWRLRVRHADFDQSGLVLHEQQERDARSFEASIRHLGDGFTGELFFRSDDADNDVAAFRRSHDSIGASLSVDADEGVELFASWVFSDIDARTLTTFYFDPDPAPVPTFVGFDGRTHSGAIGLELGSRDLRWRNDLSVTDTTGSFDVTTLNWRSDLVWQALERGALGLRYQSIDYAEDGGADDFHADLVMVYWTQTFGPRPR